MTASDISRKMDSLITQVESNSLSLQKATIIIRASNTAIRAMKMAILMNQRTKIRSAHMESLRKRMKYH